MLTVAEIVAEACLPERAVSILPMSHDLGDRMVNARHSAEMASPAGFEPTTRRLEGGRSIH